MSDLNKLWYSMGGSGRVPLSRGYLHPARWYTPDGAPPRRGHIFRGPDGMLMARDGYLRPPGERLVVVVIGLPSSGKTTLARLLVDRLRAVAVSADDYFRESMRGEDGERVDLYGFDPAGLSAAHTFSQRAASMLLRQGTELIVVHNTGSRHWEWVPYVNAATLHGASALVVDLFDAGLSDEELAARSETGTPVSAIARMRARWESL